MSESSPELRCRSWRRRASSPLREGGFPAASFACTRPPVSGLVSLVALGTGEFGEPPASSSAELDVPGQPEGSIAGVSALGWQAFLGFGGSGLEYGRANVPVPWLCNAAGLTGLLSLPRFLDLAPLLFDFCLLVLGPLPPPSAPVGIPFLAGVGLLVESFPSPSPFELPLLAGVGFLMPLFPPVAALGFSFFGLGGVDLGDDSFDPLVELASLPGMDSPSSICC